MRQKAIVKNKLFDFQLTKQIRQSYSLIPIVFVSFLGLSFAVFQSMRTIIKSPDVIINRRKNPHPWDRLYADDGEYIQYKYITTMDYKDLSQENERPKE
jgi:hypothetical protein